MKKNDRKTKSTNELLQDLMIVQLGLAGVGQREIREIVGVDIHRVSKVVKHLNKSKGVKGGNEQD